MPESATAKRVRALPRRTHRAPEQNGQAPVAFDRIIHERLRLSILRALAMNPSLTFNQLKELLHTTDGNLSVHARKLEAADYIRCEKSFAGRLPRTEYRITPTGRRAFERYLNEMEAFIRSSPRK